MNQNAQRVYLCLISKDRAPAGVLLSEVSEDPFL